MNTQTYIPSITHPKTLAGQAGFKEAQVRGGDGLVPGSHGETPKPRGRGHPRPFLESVFLAGRLRTACTTSLLPLLLLLAPPAAVRAQFYYVSTNGTITITGYAGPGGDVTIPDTINGLPVTCIGDGAFYNGYVIQPYILTSITIPDSVTNIGALAFAWCDRLSAATLGNGLISIGDMAFASCHSLANITIPSRVISIGDKAFVGCFSLTSVTISTSVTSIGDLAFADCGLTGIYFQGNAPSLGGSYVFQGDSNIVYYWCGTTGWGPTFGGRPTAPWYPPGGMCTCTTNNGTITITGYCGPGGDVTIPNTINSLPVTSIGSNAFYNCWNLTSVTIPNSVINIGDFAFESCGLTSVTIPNSVSNIGRDAFYGCTELASATIGNGVTSIGYLAFCECTRLTNVTIPDSVTSIGDFAFEFCGLTSVTIPNSVTSIGEMAFAACPLTSVTIPNSVTNIGDSAFFQCRNLTNVKIGNGVTSIGDAAFGNCTSLTSISVDALNSAYSSVDGILFSNTQTTLVQYPAGIAATSYTIANGVTSIGADAFVECASLTSITIGNGVINIGDGAFSSCTRLTGVYFAGNAPSLLGGGNVFQGDSHATVYYLPGTTGWGTTFSGRPTALWFLPNPLILTSGPGFGVQSNALGFIISWATNLPVVVEACTNPANHSWSPVQTNALTGGWSYFSDPQWADYTGRFYRLRWP